MRISQTGLDLIKEFEGCRLKAYRCPANVWTIGYGHTKTAKPGMEISQEEAERLLIDDMARYEHAVERNVKVPLEQHQFDTLVSFAFNCGEGNLKKITKYLNRNGGNYEIVPQRLMLYKKARVGGKLRTLKGLVRRRRAECDLWEGLRDDSEPAGDMPQQVEAEKPSIVSLKDSGTIKALVLALTTFITGILQVISELPPTTQILFFLTLLGLGFAGWRRWDANREGKIG